MSEASRAREKGECEMRRMRIAIVPVALAALSIPFMAGSASAKTGPDRQDGGKVYVSWGCADGTGNRANFSYDEGGLSTTVYYNNHCSETQYVQALYENGTDLGSCWHVPAQSKGSKKFSHALFQGFGGIEHGC